jgi:hypothetical protein
VHGDHANVVATVHRSSRCKRHLIHAENDDGDSCSHCITVVCAPLVVVILERRSSVDLINGDCAQVPVFTISCSFVT